MNAKESNHIKMLHKYILSFITKYYQNKLQLKCPIKWKKIYNYIFIR